MSNIKLVVSSGLRGGEGGAETCVRRSWPGRSGDSLAAEEKPTSLCLRGHGCVVGLAEPGWAC